MNTTKISSGWGTLSRPAKGEFSRLLVDDTDRCEVYIAIDATDHRVLIIRDRQGTGHSSKPIRGRHIELDLATYAGITDIYLQLNESAMSDVFNLLCNDVVAAAKSVPANRSLFDSVSARVHHWQAMFKGSRNQLLTATERRGLVGELLVLRDLIQPTFEDTSVNFWSGPLQHPHDFELNGGYIECKSGTARPMTEVEISSLEQLESDNQQLILIIQELRESTNQGENLNELVRSIGALFGAVAADTYYSCVQAAGYFVDAEYDEPRYTLANRRFFRVENGFPKISRSAVPAGISKLTYTIEVAAIAPYEINDAEEVLGA